ncbi:MAG: ferritin family protein [Planctomycetota bacterium]|jgi:rubrerythrin
MAITFNADEIFEMAEEIERNGAKFYRRAAEKTSDKETRSLLGNLAEMEDGHLRVFEEMRKELSGREKEQDIFDPDNEAALYLQVMADTHGSEGKKSPAEELTGTESIEDLLRIAINAEKDSVVFYTGLKGYVSAKAGKDKVEAIITEEISHITSLRQRLLDYRE